MAENKRRLWIRSVFVVIICLSTGYVGFAAATSGSVTQVSNSTTSNLDDQSSVGATVVATQAGSNPKDWDQARLAVVSNEGKVIYSNSTYDIYMDVDPVPNTTATVEYVAAKHLMTDAHPCVANTVYERCDRTVFIRHNLSTDTTTIFYESVQPHTGSVRTHDFDRLSEHEVAVAGISDDTVYNLNTTAGIREFSWHAQNHYPATGGGNYEEDWTHMNDVEILHDGRIMASNRNLDEIVFINRSTGIQNSWTIGSNDNHSVQYEQHNPDYVPESRGGPAVIVADSENDRVVEYQRVNGAWKQTWEYPSTWSRDADRLPNGNTLITSSLAHEVIEINQSGDVVWRFEARLPYEAERLGTGDESSGGKSAKTLSLTSVEGRSDGESRPGKSEGGRSLVSTIISGFLSIIPPIIIHGIQFVMPAWVGAPEVGTMGVAVMSAICWGGIEAYWRDYRLRTPVMRV